MEHEHLISILNAPTGMLNRVSHRQLPQHAKKPYNVTLPAGGKVPRRHDVLQDLEGTHATPRQKGT